MSRQLFGIAFDARVFFTDQALDPTSGAVRRAVGVGALLSATGAAAAAWILPQWYAALVLVATLGFEVALALTAALGARAVANKQELFLNRELTLKKRVEESAAMLMHVHEAVQIQMNTMHLGLRLLGITHGEAQRHALKTVSSARALVDNTLNCLIMHEHVDTGLGLVMPEVKHTRVERLLQQALGVVQATLGPNKMCAINTDERIVVHADQNTLYRAVLTLAADAFHSRGATEVIVSAHVKPPTPAAGRPASASSGAAFEHPFFAETQAVYNTLHIEVRDNGRRLPVPVGGRKSLFGKPSTGPAQGPCLPAEADRDASPLTRLALGAVRIMLENVTGSCSYAPCAEGAGSIVCVRVPVLPCRCTPPAVAARDPLDRVVGSLGAASRPAECSSSDAGAQSTTGSLDDLCELNSHQSDSPPGDVDKRCRNARVIVADENEFRGALLVRVLKDFVPHVVLAKNANELVGAVASGENEFDVAVVSLSLEGHRSLMAAHMIRNTGIALLGLAQPSDARKATGDLSGGLFRQVFLWPVNIGGLRRGIASAMRERPPPHGPSPHYIDLHRQHHRRSSPTPPCSQDGSSTSRSTSSLSSTDPFPDQ